MEKIEFDFDQIMRTNIDKAVLYLTMGVIGPQFGDSTNANKLRDMLMVFVNRGIPLTTACDIMLEISKIAARGEGENG